MRLQVQSLTLQTNKNKAWENSPASCEAHDLQLHKGRRGKGLLRTVTGERRAQEGHPTCVLGDEERIKGPSSTQTKTEKSRASISHGGESPSFKAHCNTNLDQHRGRSLSLVPCVYRGPE